MTAPTDILLVIVLVIVIIVGSNLLMLGMVRGSRNMKFNWFKDAGKPYRELWDRDEKASKELSQKLQDIKGKSEDTDKES